MVTWAQTQDPAYFNQVAHLLSSQPLGGISYANHNTCFTQTHKCKAAVASSGGLASAVQ